MELRKKIIHALNEIKKKKIKNLTFEYFIRDTGMSIPNQISPHRR